MQSDCAKNSATAPLESPEVRTNTTSMRVTAPTHIRCKPAKIAWQRECKGEREMKQNGRYRVLRL
jgi:hypothetical protein